MLYNHSSFRKMSWDEHYEEEHCGVLLLKVEVPVAKWSKAMDLRSFP